MWFPITDAEKLCAESTILLPDDVRLGVHWIKDEDENVYSSMKFFSSGQSEHLYMTMNPADRGNIT